MMHMEFETVLRKIKSSRGAATSRKLLYKGQQVGTSINSVYHKITKRDDSQVSLIRTQRGLRVGEINGALNLPALEDSNLTFLESKIQTLGVNYWKFGTRNNGLSTINIIGNDFSRFAESLSTDTNFSNWYFIELNSNGRPKNHEGLIGGSATISAASGFRAFRYVSASEGGDFVADSSQGIDIIRWDKDIVAGRIESKVWNPQATELPLPETDRSLWASTLAKAQSTLGHSVDFPIDAVITWVDGEDPVWKRRKDEALGRTAEEFVKDATDVSRFESLDELRYCLRSIEQYASWIRKIYVVTDRQVPPWLDLEKETKVQIVDHKEIWNETSELPVFNSHAIESNLHRIEGLSEHFLYFNDDMLLTRKVSPDHFFHANGISKVFYSRALVDFLPVLETDNVSTVAAKNARVALTDSGFPTFNRKFYHTPYALRVSIMQEMEREYPEVFAATSRAKFRSITDAALAGSFYFNYALSKGYAVPGRIKYDYIDPADPTAISRLRGIIKRRNVDVVVINDGSQLVSLAKRKELRTLIPNLLSALLPVKSSFEK